jgi:tripeptide aminopeptidase
MNITERFLKYVSFHTTSDPNTNLTPSTPGQLVFAKYLVEELQSIGLSDVEGHVLHGLLEETSGDIVIRLDRQGF